MSGKYGTSLSEALDRYFRRHGIKKRVSQAGVVADWPDLVGERISEVTTPLEVRSDGTLVVSVKSAAWMQELQMMEPAIREQLAKNGKRVRKIVWRAG